MNRLVCFFLLIGCCAVSIVSADVKVDVAPDHSDWVYAVAEPIQFTVRVTQDDTALDDIEVRWQIGPEMMEPFQRGATRLIDGQLILKSHGLDRPGFLRCTASVEIDGKTYRGMATGAYDMYKIQPTTPMPDDFRSYWESELQKVRDVPLDPVMEHLASTDKLDTYHVSFNCGPAGWGGNAKFYGMLAVPKGDGPFPALLAVPGAGIRPYQPNRGWAETGVIHLTVGIHGIPVNLEPRLYENLIPGALFNYWEINLDHRDRYYFHRVFLGCARAVDFIFQVDRFDGKTLGIHGGSQGGALSIITAALDKRIEFIASTYPAMSDHYGYLHGRAGGWPHLFRNLNLYNCTPEKIETASYYDVVNFAKQIDQPILMGLGYNDDVCPPTSMFSVYNSIAGEKEIQIIPSMGHFTVQEHSDYAYRWLKKHLQK